MADDPNPAVAAPKLARSGVVRVVGVAGTDVVLAAIFFGAAGTTAWPRAWLYYGGLLAYLVVSMVVMFLLVPGVAEVVNERGKVKKDVKLWDKVFALVYLASYLAMPAVAGLDVGRWRGPTIPFAWAVPAFAVTLLANVFAQWALVANKHAETGVRIQEDRGHSVVSTGPYRFVRHPLYVGMIVTQLVYPLAVGSVWSCVPAALTAALFVWRTAREDRTLRQELAGYEEYTRRTRHRLLPGVW
jgi:protein-S-isoprenylcysteine O-methyltransferase Ste14